MFDHLAYLWIAALAHSMPYWPCIIMAVAATARLAGVRAALAMAVIAPILVGGVQACLHGVC